MVGRSIFADIQLYSGTYFLIENNDKMETIFRRSLEESGFNIVKIDSYYFKPIGLTCIAILSESHATLHTWPEKGIYTLDVFTCGEFDPKKFVEKFQSKIPIVKTTTIKYNERGNFSK